MHGLLICVKVFANLKTERRVFMSTKTAYVLLVISILFEQIGTAFLQASNAFTLIKPTIITIIAYVVSYLLFSKLLKKINLSIAYATWTALGTISAALIGLLAFKQQISAVGWIAIFIMCAGIVILNLFGTPKEDAGEKEGGTAK